MWITPVPFHSPSHEIILASNEYFQFIQCKQGLISGVLHLSMQGKYKILLGHSTTYNVIAGKLVSTTIIPFFSWREN